MAEVSEQNGAEGTIHKQNVDKLEKLLLEGKQAYILDRFNEAESKLSEAAELSVKIFGYFAIPTFEPHYYYGKTLLELARMEEGVFSNALKGIANVTEGGNRTEADEKKDGSEETDSLTEEDEAEIAEKVCEALEENAEILEKKAVEESKNQSNIANEEGKDGSMECTKSDEEKKTKRNETTEKEEDKEGDQNENTHEDKDENIDSEENEQIIDGEDEGEKEDETLMEKDDKDETNDMDDVEYLQLAWENLEVARAVCDKHLEELSWKEKKVEVLVDLADCSIDAENYKQAIDDIDECILLMESIYEEDDRRIAQAYFIKARAHNLGKDFEIAAKVFGKSKGILEARVAKLEKISAGETEEEMLRKIKEEIGEIKSLVQEIQLKIDDSWESAESLKANNGEIDGSDTKRVQFTSVVREMPVDDVNNLVRKKAKRTAEDVPEKESKKAKNDGDAQNAIADITV